MKLYTQLNFGGNCEEAFRFYAEHLGGRITAIVTKAQIPAGNPVPPGPDNFVIHARMDIAGVALIANDVPAQYFQPVRSSYLYLEVDSVKDAERIYHLLAEGGTIGMPIAETFFASRFAQVRDRFGVLWSIIHPKAM
jgi:PhnB protein